MNSMRREVVLPNEIIRNIVQRLPTGRKPEQPRVCQQALSRSHTNPHQRRETDGRQMEVRVRRRSPIGCECVHTNLGVRPDVNPHPSAAAPTPAAPLQHALPELQQTPKSMSNQKDEDALRNAIYANRVLLSQRLIDGHRLRTMIEDDTDYQKLRERGDDIMSLHDKQVEELEARVRDLEAEYVAVTGSKYNHCEFHEMNMGTSKM